MDGVQYNFDGLPAQGMVEIIWGAPQFFVDGIGHAGVDGNGNQYNTNGDLAQGIYEGLYYVNGWLANDTMVDSIIYFGGVAAQGSINGVLYANGTWVEGWGPDNNYFSWGVSTGAYDPSGYDVNGFNIYGWNGYGINRDTGTIYDVSGYDYGGWNIGGWSTSVPYNRYTDTFYDVDGYDVNGNDINGNPRP